LTRHSPSFRDNGSPRLWWADSFFRTRRDQIVASANRLRIATMYDLREYVVADGLISYAPSLAEVYRQAGIYVAQIRLMRASTIGEIDAAFAVLAQERPNALFVGGDPFLRGDCVAREQHELITLAEQFIRSVNTWMLVA